MSTTPTTPQLIDTLDTFYQFVKNNVQEVNPDRKFGGIVEARDWPPKSMLDSAPYLLQVQQTPVRSRHQSFYAPLMLWVLEWRWAIQGSNIPQNAQASNRGDKYVINVQIMQELLSAHNPGYANKNQYSVGNDGDNNPVKVVVPYNPVDSLWWSIPSFVPKTDRTSGMIYTAGRVEVSSYVPVSVNLGS